MSDAVDHVLDQWERPDPAAWPMGIVGRITRLSVLLDRELKGFFCRYGLERREFDVLATLRRSGQPYELTAGALNRAAMVTSGAVTNRIDRLAAKGLVERVRDEGDRRSARVRLTGRGVPGADDAVAGGYVVEQSARYWAAAEGLPLPAPVTRGRRCCLPVGQANARRLAATARVPSTSH